MEWFQARLEKNSSICPSLPLTVISSIKLWVRPPGALASFRGPKATTHSSLLLQSRGDKRESHPSSTGALKQVARGKCTSSCQHLQKLMARLSCVYKFPWFPRCTLAVWTSLFGTLFICLNVQNFCTLPVTAPNGTHVYELIPLQYRL